MHEGSRLIKAMRACPRIGLDSVWYRSVDGEIFLHFYDSAKPMRPLWGLGAPARGARFTPRKGPAALYLAEDLETATREGLQVTLGTPVKPPAGSTRAVYTVTVTLTDAIDLRDKTVLSLLGTSAAELGAPWRFRKDRKMPPTQRLGRAAAVNVAVEALVFQSTKGSGACVAIFSDNLRPTSMIEVRGPAGMRQRLP